ncbi:MAG: GNAT family N-acetyltransferase [Bacteroidota bacterium]
MSLTYHIRSLTVEDIPQMHAGFLKGFSDYKIQFKLNRETFIKKFVEKLHLDFDLSVGIFYEKELIAFIFHSVNDYQGKRVLYNGGTGVSPQHRGKRLVKEMYQYILPDARKASITHSILEVLTDNVKAIKAYESVGFQKGALLKCFKATSLSFDHVNDNIGIRTQRIFDPFKYNYFNQALPSFQDVNQQIIYDRNNETVLEAYQGDQLVGYIIFHTESGRISQLAVLKEFQAKGIGSRLLKETYWLLKEKNITLINLRAEETATASFLEKRGFINEVDQYEMDLIF